MISAGIGLECPYGHVRIQVAAGNTKCPVCGVEMIADEAAPPTAMNRHCEHCGTFIGMLSHDYGHCPQCKKPW